MLVAWMWLVCGFAWLCLPFRHSSFFLLPSPLSGFEVALPRSIEAGKTPPRRQRVPDSPPPHGCTIFVLTDTNQALFCNNEDWSDPKTRIWFLPAGDRYYGAVNVGFDNGWAQGGLNTESLAFDWVAG
jgi:hypothetical protein